MFRGRWCPETTASIPAPHLPPQKGIHSPHRRSLNMYSPYSLEGPSRDAPQKGRNRWAALRVYSPQATPYRPGDPPQWLHTCLGTGLGTQDSSGSLACACWQILLGWSWTCPAVLTSVMKDKGRLEQPKYHQRLNIGPQPGGREASKITNLWLARWLRGKGTCYQAWQPELDPWATQGTRTEPTPVNCFLTSIMAGAQTLHTKKCTNNKTTNVLLIYHYPIYSVFSLCLCSYFEMGSWSPVWLELTIIKWEMTLNSWSSCLYFPGAEITGIGKGSQLCALPPIDALIYTPRTVLLQAERRWYWLLCVCLHLSQF